jgi:malonyl-CoA O-methyltransferase
MDQETITITYKSPQSLLADVRRWGAYPFEREAVSGSAARRLSKALLAALEARRRADGTLALSFEVIYGHAWKAVPRTTAEGHGIVRLEDIGRGPSRNR